MKKKVHGIRPLSDTELFMSQIKPNTSKLRMPVSIWDGSAILSAWLGWELSLWNNFGMALIETAYLFVC